MLFVGIHYIYIYIYNNQVTVLYKCAIMPFIQPNQSCDLSDKLLPAETLIIGWTY